MTASITVNARTFADAVEVAHDIMFENSHVASVKAHVKDDNEAHTFVRCSVCDGEQGEWERDACECCSSWRPCTQCDANGVEW